MAHGTWRTALLCVWLLSARPLVCWSIGQVSEEYPHLIFDAFDTALGRRLKNILRFLFPVPKPDSKRVMTFANRNDYISFRSDAARDPPLESARHWLDRCSVTRAALWCLHVFVRLQTSYV
jgi:hypothetical protein